MQGTMWVESDVGKGSKFFFTVSAQLGSISPRILQEKMAVFKNRSILFVGTRHDKPSIAHRIQSLGLHPIIVHDLQTLATTTDSHYIDTIVTESAEIVSLWSFSNPLLQQTNRSVKTTQVRAMPRLKFIPIVLIESVRLLSVLSSHDLQLTSVKIVG